MIELASQTDYRNSELKAELDRRKKVYSLEICGVKWLSILRTGKICRSTS